MTTATPLIFYVLMGSQTNEKLRRGFDHRWAQAQRKHEMKVHGLLKQIDSLSAQSAARLSHDDAAV